MNSNSWLNGSVTLTGLLDVYANTLNLIDYDDEPQTNILAIFFPYKNISGLTTENVPIGGGLYYTRKIFVPNADLTYDDLHLPGLKSLLEYLDFNFRRKDDDSIVNNYNTINNKYNLRIHNDDYYVSQKKIINNNFITNNTNKQFNYSYNNEDYYDIKKIFNIKKNQYTHEDHTSYNYNKKNTINVSRNVFNTYEGNYSVNSNKVYNNQKYYLFMDEFNTVNTIKKINNEKHIHLLQDEYINATKKHYHKNNYFFNNYDDTQYIVNKNNSIKNYYNNNDVYENYQKVTKNISQTINNIKQNHINIDDTYNLFSVKKSIFNNSYNITTHNHYEHNSENIYAITKKKSIKHYDFNYDHTDVIIKKTTKNTNICNSIDNTIITYNKKYRINKYIHFNNYDDTVISKQNKHVHNTFHIDLHNESLFNVKRSYYTVNNIRSLITQQDDNVYVTKKHFNKQIAINFIDMNNYWRTVKTTNNLIYKRFSVNFDEMNNYKKITNNIKRIAHNNFYENVGITNKKIYNKYVNFSVFDDSTFIVKRKTVHKHISYNNNEEVHFSKKIINNNSRHLHLQNEEVINKNVFVRNTYNDNSRHLYLQNEEIINNTVLKTYNDNSRHLHIQNEEIIHNNVKKTIHSRHLHIQNEELINNNTKKTINNSYSYYNSEQFHKYDFFYYMPFKPEYIQALQQQINDLRAQVLELQSLIT